ncbi:hypothetical protein SDC9_132733 [bioreactor metagenome]|uniref:Uncharacterized protein n=1 Tax=bioreactor metagenome TaxID=1076179 RepID=A0A645DAM4_9ZZZZ
MLQVGADDMVAGAEEAGDGHVQRLGRVSGKDHVFRSGAAEEPGKLLPGLENNAGGAEGTLMGAAGAVAHAAHGGYHRVDHCRGLLQGGSRVIQINHGLITFEAPVSFSTITYILVTPPTFSFSVRP